MVYGLGFQVSGLRLADPSSEELNGKGMAQWFWGLGLGFRVETAVCCGMWSPGLTVKHVWFVDQVR